MNIPFFIRQFISYSLFILLIIVLAACSSNQDRSVIDGKWDFSMTSPFGVVTASVTTIGTGEKLSGSFDLGNGRVWQIENGTVAEESISFSIDRDGSPMVYEMSAVIDGDVATGVARAMGAEAPWSMTRVD